MRAFPQSHRQHEIRKIRSELERNSFPRLQMLLLVSITGASGFIASYILLHSGVLEMWQRYLASFGVAYLMFLFLLWLWLRTRAEDYADFPDISGFPSPASGNSGTCYNGKGGDFGGGGASGSFDTPPEGVSTFSDASSPISDALGTAAEAEEFAIPLVVLILFGAVLFSSLFMVYSAPALFAELLFDGVLSASLYRRLRGLEMHHWLNTAVRRTALPFMLTATIAAASGWGMGRYAPEAHSIGDVIAHARQAS